MSVCTGKKVIHIITGLGNGGAEGVLYRLCLNCSSAEHVVISLLDDGKYGPLLKDAGVDVRSLNLSASPISLIKVIKLFLTIRQLSPDVVQTWMYHADLLGGICAKFAGVKNICWNVRHSDLKAGVKATTRLLVFLSSRISHFIPNRIVYCGFHSRSIHENLGYCRSIGVVIPNGFGVSALKKRVGAYKDNRLTIGMLARYNNQKNHMGLIKALGKIREKYEFDVLLGGPNVSKDNFSLKEMLVLSGLENSVELMGEIDDVAAFYGRLDIHVLPSVSGEGFPNVVAESMMFGVPNVVTDVGDSKYIVGDLGFVASSLDDTAIEAALRTAIELFISSPTEWISLRSNVRERIQINFSLNKMVVNYENLWLGAESELSP
jgi:glycosyltransferase involved in cell wall biosynthesis